MARCVIFCAGEFDGLLAPLRTDDFLLAADGGLAHIQKLGLTANGILGDFDSLGYVPDSAQVFPVEKDDTDAMLAAKKGLELGYRDFLFYGSLDGPRLDHTVANFQTLQYLSDRGGIGYLIGKRYIVTVLTKGKIEFKDTASGILSLFCMGETAQNVTIEGLKYPLAKGTLCPGFPLGVSNHFIGKKARISVENGSLLIFYDRENGLPLYHSREE